MRAITFPEVNLELAKDQPEYDTLPVYVHWQEKLLPVPEHRRFVGGNTVEMRKIAMEMVACFELTDEEVAEIVKTKKLWYRQMIFGNKFQPMNIFVDNPFVQKEVKEE